MDMLKHLNNAVQYIEDNLSSDIDLSQAARRACLTLDSFQRFFSYMTGMTAAEYIRRRRLTLAAYDLQQGSGRVIDIAVKYGWGSADSFARAFARQHGITPTAARSSGSQIKICLPVSFHITINGAKEMNYRLVDLDETTVYGSSFHYDQDLFPHRESLRRIMWDEKAGDIPGRICSGHWNEPNNTAYDGLWYGIWQNDSYAIARAKEQVKDPASLELHTVPAGKYAAFTTEPGGYAWVELPKLFDLIFNSWLPVSSFNLAGDHIIELYHLWTDGDVRSKKRYYEVLIPVEEK